MKPYVKLCHAFRSAYCRLLCPQTCVLCGKDSTAGLPLCDDCLKTDFLPYLEPPVSTLTENAVFRCRHCGKILISETDYCSRCRSAAEGEVSLPDYCDRIFSLFPYIGLGQKLLPLWKNNNIRAFSAVFAPFIFHFFVRHTEYAGIPIVPVPPRPKKLREKGWDQIDDLVKELAACPGIPICRCLKRDDGTPQKKLSKAERAVNLHGKINICISAVPEKLILLDDVITTGATLNACAQVLKRHGCKTVYALSLFFD